MVIGHIWRRLAAKGLNDYATALLDDILVPAQHGEGAYGTRETVEKDDWAKEAIK